MRGDVGDVLVLLARPVVVDISSASLRILFFTSKFCSCSSSNYLKFFSCCWWHALTLAFEISAHVCVSADFQGLSIIALCAQKLIFIFVVFVLPRTKITTVLFYLVSAELFFLRHAVWSPWGPADGLHGVSLWRSGQVPRQVLPWRAVAAFAPLAGFGSVLAFWPPLGFLFLLFRG